MTRPAAGDGLNHLDEAALNYLISISGKKTDLRDVFKAGALWAEKHSPRIHKLVSDIEGILYAHSSQEGIYNWGEPLRSLREALAAWRGEK